jgi:hypothetical protein
MADECLSNDSGATRSLAQCELDALPAGLTQLEEIKTCRGFADRCAFVMGPARSGTTILAQIVSANENAFLTTEANFYLASAYPRFREWYNKQHMEFANQVSKCSYAPDFAYPGQEAWWQWLAAAAGYFELVGDKMEFSSKHLHSLNSYALMSFFETRFYNSRYIFVFRDPVQTILSAAALSWVKEPFAPIIAWTSVVKVWADFIRVFPRTMTVLHSELDELKIAEIGSFLGLDLSESARLLDDRERRVHTPEDYEIKGFAARIAPLLQMIYGEITAAVEMERVLLQSDQKRMRLDRSGTLLRSARPEIAFVTTPVGRAWNLADQLISELEAERQS